MKEENLSKITELENKYKSLLIDIKRLEEDNIETNNLLYEILNTLDSIQNNHDIQ